MKRSLILKYVIMLGLLVLVAQPVSANNDTRFSQVINTGVLSTDILDNNRALVDNPYVAMSALHVSMQCQTSTGTYGTNTQRIYVENPGATATGWVLSIAATEGSSAVWVSGADQYSFNDDTDTGCENGQMTINPSGSTITPYESSSLTGIVRGAPASFNAGVVDSIELLNAGATSDDYWLGYLTGVAISQKIPKATPTGIYTIDLTQTVVAQ